MRTDGRLPDQLRPIRAITDYLVTAEGSVLIEYGHTRVLCTASVEDSVPPFLRGSGRGWVTAEYSMLPRSTITRTPREIGKGRPSGRTQEIQRLIGRSLRAVTNTKAMGEQSILIDCDVIQADGGTRTAAITGSFVAMALAVKKVREFKRWPTNPLTDYLAAVSVGIVNGEPMLDLCYEEDSKAGVDMNLVMTGEGKFVEVQATAEQGAFDNDQMTRMLELGRKGVREILELQRSLVTLQ